MIEKKKIKDFLIYYIAQRVIVFPLDDYLPILADNIIRSFMEWDLLDNKLITQREKYFKYFLEKELDTLLNLFIIIFKDLNVKIFTIYKNNTLSSEYSEYFIDPINFGNIVKKVYKKKTKYYKELKNNDLFLSTEGSFKGLRVGVPTGDDLEFFSKYLDF
jgi:hypothetical protein